MTLLKGCTVVQTLAPLPSRTRAFQGLSSPKTFGMIALLSRDISVERSRLDRRRPERACVNTNRPKSLTFAQSVRTKVRFRKEYKLDCEVSKEQTLAEGLTELVCKTYDVC